MAPIVHELKKHSDQFKTKVCLTAQHREMLDQVLDFFEIKSDFDLNLMKPNQSLFGLTSRIFSELEVVLDEFSPDYVFVHGDTTTTMAGAIAGFYSKAKICHIEAGLRTNNKYAPFPEEINRGIVGRVADYHFAPTIISQQNLIKENIIQDSICVTGNTVIDALKFSVEKVKTLEIDELTYLKEHVNWKKRIILITGHRRENFGQAFKNIFHAIKNIAEEEDVEIIYPVHLNPNVQEPVNQILKGLSNVHLVSPLSYPGFVWLMNKAYLIITDSGGIQEEAPFLGKPVLVLRETTERPEALEAGKVKLVGSDQKKIISSTKLLLNDTEEYQKMVKGENPFGDGTASKQIIKFLKQSKNG